MNNKDIEVTEKIIYWSVRILLAIFAVIVVIVVTF